MPKEKTLAARMNRLHAGDAAKVRRCLASATKKISEALECERPASTTADDYLKLRTLRRELAERLADFDRRHGLRG